MATERNACPRCLEFEEEIRVLQLQLAASGRYVTYSPGPKLQPECRPRGPALADSESEWECGFRFPSRLDTVGSFRGTEAPGLGRPLAARHARPGQTEIPHRRAHGRSRAPWGRQVSGSGSRVLPPYAAWARLKDMQQVVADQPAIAHAVRCLRLYDQLELTIELLRQHDWPEFVEA